MEFLAPMERKRGRPKQSELDRLKTRAWCRIVYLAASIEAGRLLIDSELVKALGAKLRPSSALNDPKHWARYRQGKRTPGRETLEDIERIYPGTMRVFESGPNFSYLWEALGGNAREALSQTEDEWRNAVPVEHLIHIPERIGENAKGERERYPEQEDTQDVLVPKSLAERWGLVPGMRLNLAEKLRPWERLQDLCGSPVSESFHTTYAAAAVLDLDPSATFTKEERLKARRFVQLPYSAGLAYQIAQARLHGRNELTLPEWSGLRVSYKKGETPQELQARISHEEEEYSRMWEDFERVSGLKFKFCVGVPIKFDQ